MDSAQATIWTEGKTDWKHLKKASERLRLNLQLSFHEAEEGDQGAEALLRKCKIFAETPQPISMIFVFDHDDDSIVRQVSDTSTGYKNWGNNVFSFAIPIPSHRVGYDNVCIEYYYSDDEIRTEDKHGRRLFLTSEFNELSGTCTHDPTIHLGNVNKLKGVTAANRAKIIDSQVFRGDTNIALSKSDFSDYVYSDVHPFSAFSVQQFTKIFDIISAIMTAARPRISLVFPDLREVPNNLQGDRSLSESISIIFEMMVNVLEIAMYIFTASTIRSYENLIVSEPRESAKKVRPIKKIITERFTSPSFATLTELTRHCFHLITEGAPDELLKMKECLANDFLLGAIGDALNDLEMIYSPHPTRGPLISRAQLRRRLFEYVIREISVYGNKVEFLRTDIDHLQPDLQLRIDTWQNALQILVDAVHPILSQEFVLESIEQVDTTNRNYQVSVRSYRNGIASTAQRIISFEELEEYEGNASFLLMKSSGAQVSLHVFPFLVIKDDKLYYYKRTRAVGYEYYSRSDRSVYVVQTKRKFSQAVFKVGGRGGQQALFWTEVLPTVSDKSGIKANIPTEGPVEFVGRRRQIAKIRREIIEIPNQNGIIYGVGGVGKTALMTEVSRELFDEEDQEDVLFDNIIWVSAKSTYFNPLVDVVETGKRHFESLDNVVSTVLDFFEYEDLDGYTSEDKKALLLELLADHRVLLVLDNYESISATEREAIIKFLEVEVKHALRRKPENFKVMITSREQIPCGLHQIGLSGLDLRESKQLMASLYKQYQSGKSEELSDDQKVMLHKATGGIPIIIKHCFGQIYEFSRPFDSVVTSFARVTTKKVVEFSFEEILKLLRVDPYQLEIILLLDLINCPLMIRHIAEILGRSESEIETKIPSLVNFQCVKRVNQGREEKYGINEEIRLLTRRLAQENSQLIQEIRKKVMSNFTIEKRMDYTTEEVGILRIFDNYLSEKQYLEAERFISDQLKEKPHSILLKYHYARYLKEEKGDIEQAIDILEGIREVGSNHPSILRRLISCYTSLEIPNYTRASTYIAQLESGALDDETLKREIGEFYVRWSISIKMNREISFDPLDEILRQQKYKELADRALSWLSQIKIKTHEVYYLLAHSHFNKWDYDDASKMIEKAISLSKGEPRFRPAYTYLRNLIFTQREKHSD